MAAPEESLTSETAIHPDQLGCLPPDTLCLSLCPEYPYFPSVVLSATRARKQKALKRKVRELEEGVVTGSCVRFFGVNRCDVVGVTDIEPFIVRDEVFQTWIWSSSVAKQKQMRWMPFDAKMKEQWMNAFEEANQYGEESSSRPLPRMTRESIGLTNDNDGSSCKISNGTIVWTILQDSPIWPAYVSSLSEDQRRRYMDELRSEEPVPLIFINDPQCTEPLFTSTDALMGFSADDPVWTEHMRQRSIMDMDSKGWEKPTHKLWQQWEKACTDAVEMCRPGIKSGTQLSNRSSIGQCLSSKVVES